MDRAFRVLGGDLRRSFFQPMVWMRVNGSGERRGPTASLFGFAGEQPEQVGEAVDELEQQRADGAAVGGQRAEPALAAAGGHAGEVEGGGAWVGAGGGPAVEGEAARRR